MTEVDTQLVLLIGGIAVILAGGLLALALTPWPRIAGTASTLSVVVGAGMGLIPVAQALSSGTVLSFARPWAIPNGALLLELDPLSAFFLAPVLVLSAMAGIYGREYMLSRVTLRSGLPFFGFHLMVAGMALVVLARNGVLFLVSWEAMAVAAFFLVSYDHEDPAARRAGWVYLIATHIGAAALFAMFLLLARGAGGYNFAQFAAAPPSGPKALAVVLLALVGFGAKAGFVPLHVWLPEAHAAAPSHISAVMSGALIKLGLYGLLRIFLIVGTPAGWWGPSLAGIGLVGAVLGISLALYQRDLKRAFAYSSVENIGLIALALGIAYWAASRGENEAASLAMAGGLLHVWNHTLMKGTMFFAAGSVVHATHTRRLAQLGGVARRMPLTALGMTVAAVALSALPPLNGFVSEWLIYQGLIRPGLEVQGPISLLPLLAVGVVSLVGALALLSFARVLGITLLGQPRSKHAEAARESSPWLLFPIALLAIACIGAALAPGPVIALTAPVAAQLFGRSGPPPLTPTAGSLPALAAFNLILWASCLLLGLVAWWLYRARPWAAQETWGCGYAAPRPRTQYGALSFAQLAAENILPPLLRPKVVHSRLRGLFPTASRLELDDTDPLTRGAYQPMFARGAGRLSSFTWIQRGALHSYLLYVLLAVVLGMVWLSVRGWGAR